jgi:hypothetical protein
MRYLYVLVIIATVLSLALSGCNVVINVPAGSSGNNPSGNNPSGNNPSGNNPSGGTPNFGVQTKTSDCMARGPLQDQACTPGAIIATATTDQICTPGYSRSVRNVPVSEKDQVYAEYGIASHSPGEYEVDHLVSLELGGSNDISNLWPEAASPVPGFHQKDMVENYLHEQVCSGAVPLKQAQIQIATDWLVIYKQCCANG